MASHFIQVEVQPGMFPSEKGVSFKAGGSRYNLFVDESVLTDHYLPVSVLKETQDNHLVVRLPRETMTSGTTITVPREIVVKR